MLILLSIKAISQFERLDSITLVNNINKSVTEIHFSIFKRNNYKEVLNNYSAFLIINEKDTTRLFNDSIVIVHNLGYYNNPKLDLVIFYKFKKFEINDIEKIIYSPVANICFVINSFCIGNKYTLHRFGEIYSPTSKFYKPDIYTRTISEYLPIGQEGYLPDSVIIKQNRKKNKFIIPYW